MDTVAEKAREEKRIQRIDFDWRSSLYQCAKDRLQAENPKVEDLIHAEEELIYLGKLSDEEDLLADCRKRIELAIAGLQEEAEESRDLAGLIKVMESLEKIAERPGSSPAEKEFLRKAQEKKRKLARTRRRKAWIRRGLILFSLAILAAIMVIFPYYYQNIQKRMLTRADQMAREGNYEGALSDYWKLTQGFYQEEAARAIPDCQKKLGYRKMETGDFAYAIKLLQSAGDREGVRKARTGWGDACLADKDYKTAIEQYRMVDDKGRVEKARLAWGENLIAEGKYDEGIKKIRKTKDSEERKQILKEAYAGRCKEAIKKAEAAISGGAKEEEISRSLAKIGSNLDDVDSLLAYCRWIDQKDRKPGDIFPDGVMVKDLKLAAYQPWKKEKDLSSMPVDKKTKILVLARNLSIEQDDRFLQTSIKKMPPEEIQSEDLPWDAEEDNNYEIRLLPEAIYRFSPDWRAESLEESTLFLLADAAYQKGNWAELTREVKIGTGRHKMPLTTYGWYPLLIEYDAVTIYEKEKPDRYMILAAKENLPPWEESVLNRQYEINDKKSYDYTLFWGKSDPEYLKKALQEEVERINAIPK